MKPCSLKVEGLKQAELDIVRYVQGVSFPELSKLKDSHHPANERSMKKIIKQSKRSLCKLNVTDGVLVVGGRLNNARLMKKRNIQ